MRVRERPLEHLTLLNAIVAIFYSPLPAVCPDLVICGLQVAAFAYIIQFSSNPFLTSKTALEEVRASVINPATTKRVPQQRKMHVSQEDWSKTASRPTPPTQSTL